MENSHIVYIKFNDTPKMFADFKSDFPTINYLRGLGYKGSSILLRDGIRRSRKLFADVDETKRTKQTSKTHKIEKRNERERCRVQAVNDAFCRLRRLIPVIGARRKRISKVKTLRKAVQYIMHLQTILQSFT